MLRGSFLIKYESGKSQVVYKKTSGRFPYQTYTDDWSVDLKADIL